MCRINIFGTGTDSSLARIERFTADSPRLDATKSEKNTEAPTTDTSQKLP